MSETRLLNNLDELIGMKCSYDISENEGWIEHTSVACTVTGFLIELEESFPYQIMVSVQLEVETSMRELIKQCKSNNLFIYKNEDFSRKDYRGYADSIINYLKEEGTLLDNIVFDRY